SPDSKAAEQQHSTTRRQHEGSQQRASILECGCPLPLFIKDTTQSQTPQPIIALIYDTGGPGFDFDLVLTDGVGETHNLCPRISMRPVLHNFSISIPPGKMYECGIEEKPERNCGCRCHQLALPLLSRTAWNYFYHAQ